LLFVEKADKQTQFVIGTVYGIYSKALLSKLNCFDSLQNFVGVRCTTQQFIATFCKSEKPVFHQEHPCFKNHSF
jgi:hypothetical protein